MDTVTKKVRCMEAIERERRGVRKRQRGPSSQAGCVGGDFSSRSRAKFIYFPGSYNEILLSTLL